ncbi:MAG: aminomethyl-transferring glycine dehydrogenase subunit GcvPA [Sporolactobacillus sp.]
MKHFRYLPITDDDRREMLGTIGKSSVEELFADIPKALRCSHSLALEPALSEPALVSLFRTFAESNSSSTQFPSFLGAGVYEHYIPAVVDSVLSRSEFYTAYTPYQAEVSQGELQAIFEFQTMICRLTGMDAANSSMYDASTALAEAALLSAGASGRKQIVVFDTLHPHYRDVLTTYAHGRGLQVVSVPEHDGHADLSVLEQTISEATACVIVQYPNFYGQIEDLRTIEQLVHQTAKVHVIVSADPLALALLKSPGELGADIVTGDCQPLGIPAAFGGPHCGYFAVRKPLIRKMPGRIVGETLDQDGHRGYVLTLQAREQHIRRDKATSNICSNQALYALAAAVAMTAFGKSGLRELAEQNVQKAYYAARQLQASGLEVSSTGFFNEFVVNCKQNVTLVNHQLLEKGLIGGFDLERIHAKRKGQMLVAVTELRTKADIERLTAELGAIVNA